jgi:hypothetical protein
MLAGGWQGLKVGLGVKRLALTGIAALAVALGAFAQGMIDLNHSITPYGVTVDKTFVNGGTFLMTGGFGPGAGGGGFPLAAARRRFTFRFANRATESSWRGSSQRLRPDWRQKAISGLSATVTPTNGSAFTATFGTSTCGRI